MKRTAGFTLPIILLLFLLLPSAAGALTAGGQPLIDVPDRLPAVVGESVVVTVNLDSDGEAISGVIFSLDTEPACLALNPTDANADGIPDAAQFVLPPQFSPSLSYQPGDEDGEIDVVITDYSPPLAALPNGPLVALRFEVVCTPAANENSRISDLLFSNYPPVSFGNPAGESVPGLSSPGSIKVTWAPAVTPTPTATASATSSQTPTETPTPTATPTPTETSTRVATATSTPTPTATATATATATVDPGGAGGDDTPVPLEPRLFLPLASK